MPNEDSLVRWQGAQQNKNFFKENAEGVKMHCYMLVGGNETSEHSGSFDLNPKKEIRSVEKRETIFPVAVSSQ